VLILPYLLCPYDSKLYDFCRLFFLYVKNIEHQTLVSFLLFTSIDQIPFNMKTCRAI
jgi:hypothetical protein